MLDERTVVVEMTGIMGAGFLPGLLQEIHAQLIAKFKKLDRRSSKTANLYVRFHIDNTAAQNRTPSERGRVMELITRKPVYGTDDWNALLAALRRTDQLFVEVMNEIPQRIDLVLRRGGFLQPCILLDDPHREEAMIFRGRPPQIMLFLWANLEETRKAFEGDKALREVLEREPEAFNSTPEKAVDQQKSFRERVKRLPAVLQLERRSGDRDVLAGSIIERLIPVLPAHGLTVVPKITVFIAHASADLQFASRLKADLEAQGVNCWFAPDNSTIGAAFPEEIREQIEMCDKFMVIVSELALKSEWVKREVETALNRQNRSAKSILVPIRLDAAVFAATVPWAVDLRDRLTFGDFSDWQNNERYGTELAKLLNGMRSRIQRSTARSNSSGGRGQ